MATNTNVKKVLFEFHGPDGSSRRVIAAPALRAAPAFETFNAADGRWHQDALQHIPPLLLMQIGLRLAGEGPPVGIAVEGDAMTIVVGALAMEQESPPAPPMSDLHDRVGRLEALQQSGWSAAYDELVKTLTGEMNGLGIPGTSVERFGLVPAIKAALNHIKVFQRDLVAERDTARSDCERLRRIMFANDSVLFDGRPDRTRSCSCCHAGAVPDPYALAPLDIAVKGAPVNSVMAVAVGSVDIFETTREAREIADRARRPVAFDCQGFAVVVNPDENPDAVARAWWWTRHGETPEQSAARR